MPTTFRLKFATVFQLHVDLVRPFDYVIVRVDESILPNDEPGAFALAPVAVPRSAARLVFVLRLLEKKIVQRRCVRPVILLRDLDDHHGRRDDLEHFRERAVELVDNVFPGIGRGWRDGRGGTGFRLRKRRRRPQRQGKSEDQRNDAHDWWLDSPFTIAVQPSERERRGLVLHPMVITDDKALRSYPAW